MPNIKSKFLWASAIVAGFSIALLLVLQLSPGKTGNADRRNDVTGETAVTGDVKPAHNDDLTAQATTESDGLDAAWLDDAQMKIEKATANRRHQFLWDGMALMDQPEGYTNWLVRISPNGRFAAFYSTRGSPSADTNRSGIIVVDRQLGSQSVVPAPDETVFSFRSIRSVEWGEGNTLYIVEDATSGLKTPKWETMTREERLQEVNKKHELLYAWKPGDSEVRILGRISDYSQSLATDGDRVRLVTRPKGTANVINLLEYGDEGLLSSQTIEISRNGQSIDCDGPRLMSRRNELWFVTYEKDKNNTPTRAWLAMSDLNLPGSEAQLVVPDVGVDKFAWSPNGEKLLFMKDDGQLNLYMSRPDALNKPVLLTSKESRGNRWKPSFAGFSPDGRTLYLNALAKETISVTEEYYVAGNFQIYKYGLPN